jgi:hypothetical protein
MLSVPSAYSQSISFTGHSHTHSVFKFFSQFLSLSIILNCSLHLSVAVDFSFTSWISQFCFLGFHFWLVLSGYQCSFTICILPSFIHVYPSLPIFAVYVPRSLWLVEWFVVFVSVFWGTFLSAIPKPHRNAFKFSNFFQAQFHNELITTRFLITDYIHF